MAFHDNAPDGYGGGDDFSVMIVAAGPLHDGGLVHAIAVTQPVTSWTVLRCYDDFKTLGDTLAQFLPGVPAYPTAFKYDGVDINIILNSRNVMQSWLDAILMYPGARENPEMKRFLTCDANMVPPHLAGVSWTNFPPNLSCRAELDGGSDVNDMEMSDMFEGDDDGVSEEDDDDTEDFVLPSIRYKAKDEPITHEDEMDFKAFASEVEMVDDIGSLAQSLGASHLGRSIQRQAEIETLNQSRGVSQPSDENQCHGLQLKFPTPQLKEGGFGGLSNVMENAKRQGMVAGIGDSFFQKRPVSAPKLDSFEVLKVIGKGSFGKVFLVREKKTGEMYALKVLRKDNIIKRNQVEHTKTERSVLGYVKHPFIVGLNMAFQSKDKLYFVLDYCAGGELFFHLGKVGKFDVPRARFYAAEIVLAISYVHSLGIIYRDLKPENVLLDAKGHVRLTDFGLSKEGINSSSSGAHSFCGTPEYLAPEILSRQGHGRAVDWWSMGALLYEMLTGEPPFYCRDKKKLFENIMNSKLDYPVSLDRSTNSLLRGLLTRDPTQRLGSGPGDVGDIKGHDFFRTVDWVRLARGEIAPPWVPEISGSMDTSQFAREFTKMPVHSPQSFQPQPGFGTPPAENHFGGFTFTDTSFLETRAEQ